MISMLTNKDPLLFNKVVSYLTEKLSGKIYHYVIQHGGRAEDVGELLDDALMVAHQYALSQKFKKNTSIPAFVFQVSKYQFLKNIRAEQHKKTIQVDDVLYNLKEEEEVLDYDEVHMKALKLVLNELKPPCKEVLVDFYYKNFTMHEIAQKYNLGSEQAAKNRKYRCIKKLRELFLKQEK